MSHLRGNGFHTVIKPFLNEKTYFALYQSGNLLAKIHAIAESYLRRMALLSEARSYDLVFVHREAAPAGPPVIEWWITKVLGKKLIYDFDDAIWLTDNRGESSFQKALRWRSKVSSICKWSYRISCGNEYLASYARRFNPAVVVNPTTIDTGREHTPVLQKHLAENAVTIGWSGSRSTLKYLNELLPVLQSIEERYPKVQTLVIADANPRLPLKNFRFLPWIETSEIADLQNLDIGLMPLPDDEWTRGKCGLKALQYMAIGIPALVSPVGVNRKITEHGKEGYWCTSPSEWYDRLEEMILDPGLRKNIGTRAKKKVAEHYSVASNSDNFLSLFR